MNFDPDFKSSEKKIICLQHFIVEERNLVHDLGLMTVTQS